MSGSRTCRRQNETLDADDRFYALVGHFAEIWLETPAEARRAITAHTFTNQNLDVNLTAEQNQALIDALQIIELLSEEEGDDLQHGVVAHGEEEISLSTPN